MPHRRHFWVCIAVVLLQADALRFVYLKEGQTRFSCRSRRGTTDHCCAKATEAEFGRPWFFSSRSVESHGAQPTKDRFGGLSTRSMISSCHDTRPDPLPDESPLRILNLKVTVYCSPDAQIEIDNEAMYYLIQDEDTLGVNTKKGRCAKNDHGVQKVYATSVAQQVKRLEIGSRSAVLPEVSANEPQPQIPEPVLPIEVTEHAICSDTASSSADHESLGSSEDEVLDAASIIMTLSAGLWLSPTSEGEHL